MGDTICQNMNTLWVKLTHGVRMCYSGEVAIEKVYIFTVIGASPSQTTIGLHQQYSVDCKVHWDIGLLNKV